MATGFPAPQLAVIPSNGSHHQPLADAVRHRDSEELQESVCGIVELLGAALAAAALHVGCGVRRQSRCPHCGDLQPERTRPLSTRWARASTDGRSISKFGRTADTTQYFAGYSSMYNGLQVKLNRRFFNGLSVTTAYTLAKGMSYPDRRRWQHLELHQRRGAATRAPISTESRPSYRATCTTCRSASGASGCINGILAKTIGGWQFNGILTLMTGTPMTFGRQRHVAEYAGQPRRRRTRWRKSPSCTASTHRPRAAARGSAWRALCSRRGCASESSGRNILSGPNFFNADAVAVQDLQLHREDEDGNPR